MRLCAGREPRLPPDVALAYAAVLKAPPSRRPRAALERLGRGFGGSAAANGDPAIGSTNVTASTFGFAGGSTIASRPTPSSALRLPAAAPIGAWRRDWAAAAATRFRPAFTARLFGPAYFAAALSFTNDWFTTSRTALGRSLNASFAGQASAPGGGRLPLRRAAADRHDALCGVAGAEFHTPGYSETDLPAAASGSPTTR